MFLRMTRNPYICIPSCTAAFCRSYSTRCWCGTKQVSSPRRRQATYALCTSPMGLLCGRNVQSSFESQTSHSGKPNGVLDHSLCRKVFNWSPILVMKWFDIVVCNHEAFFFCERLSASMARSLRFELYLYTAVDSRPGPGGSRTTASCQS